MGMGMGMGIEVGIGTGTGIGIGIGMGIGMGIGTDTGMGMEMQGWRELSNGSYYPITIEACFKYKMCKQHILGLCMLIYITITNWCCQ